MNELNKDKPIKVIYDSSPFSVEEKGFGGISRYFTELFKRLPRYDIEPEITTVATNNVFLQMAPFNVPKAKVSAMEIMPKIKFRGKVRLIRAIAKLFPCLLPIASVVNRKSFKKALCNAQYDLIHLTGDHIYFDDWPRCMKKCPIIITVYDLIPEYLSGGRIIKQRKQILERCSHVIAISENTKRELLKRYKIEDEKVTVVHLGYTENICERQEKNRFDYDYILFVGKRQGYKNFIWFIRELAPLMKEFSSLHLLCTGYQFSELEKGVISSLGLDSRVHARFMGDQELMAAYQSAKVFVFPSRQEGFGLPILEAFAARCPVVLTDSHCFPEIGGDAALYFNPDDGEGLRKQIRRVLGNDKDAVELRRCLIDKEKEQLLKFSWEKCAEETAIVYRKVLSDSVLVK